MKLFSFFFLLTILTSCATSKQTTNFSSIVKITDKSIQYSDGKKNKIPFVKAKNTIIIYLVRHAEKAKGGKNPILTKEGTIRANKLNNILKEANLDKVFSTDYHRTQLTALPTAEAYNQPIISYNPRDLKSFAQQIKEEEIGNKILVVGHSNTTPTLVNELMGKEQFPMIEESVYDHLFVVAISQKGEVKVLDLEY